MKKSTILTCVGAIGVIVTSVLVAKAAPKAVRVIEEVETAKGEELTKLEVIKSVVPVYIPAIVVGASTIACIFGANVLNKRDQAALVSAYALADNAYREYKDKINNLISDDTKAQIKEAIAKDQYEENRCVSDEKQLFFDFNTMRYFESTLDEVIQKVTMDDGMECYIIATPYESPLHCFVD